MCLKVLNVDDDISWNRKIQDIFENNPNVSFDFTRSYEEAQELIVNKEYDLYSFDHRIIVENQIKPAIIRLIRFKSKHSNEKYEKPIVSITNYLSDIAEQHKQKLFDYRLKKDLSKNEDIKLFFLNALYESKIKNISYIIKKERNIIIQALYTDNLKTLIIEERLDSEEIKEIREAANDIKNIEKNMRNTSQILFQANGHVIEVNQNSVIVELYTSNGEIKREFDSLRFKSVGLCFQDAYFSLKMVQKGGDVITRLKRLKPKISKRTIDEIDGIDTNIFPAN